MRIGMKLEIGFAEQDAWRTLAGRRDVLALLRALGVSAVETPVGAETDGSALAHHLRLCEEAGLVISLHPYSEGTRANPAYFAPDAGNGCAALHTGFLAVAAEAALRQHVPAVVLEVLPGAFLAMGGLAALERSISALVSFHRQ